LTDECICTVKLLVVCQNRPPADHRINLQSINIQEERKKGLTGRTRPLKKLARDLWTVSYSTQPLFKSWNGYIMYTNIRWLDGTVEECVPQLLGPKINSWLTFLMVSKSFKPLQSTLRSNDYHRLWQNKCVNYESWQNQMHQSLN